MLTNNCLSLCVLADSVWNSTYDQRHKNNQAVIDFVNLDVKLTVSTFQLKQGYITADTEHSMFEMDTEVNM